MKLTNEEQKGDQLESFVLGFCFRSCSFLNLGAINLEPFELSEVYRNANLDILYYRPGIYNHPALK